MLSRRGLLQSAGTSLISSPANAWKLGFVPRALNSRIVYIGDSITALANWQNYCYMANLISGGRYYTPNGFQMGISGNNSTQILARIPDALALNPAILVIEAGTNDAANDPTTTINNLTSMYTQAQAVGVLVVGVTVLPDINNVERVAVNNFIRSYPGVRAANCTPGFNNPTMTSDGVHPNLLGGLFMGNIVATVIATLISGASIFTVTTGQLSPNPTMSGSITPPAHGGDVVGTGVIPTGFRLYESGGTTFTSSMVGTQDTAGNGANEQIITIANGAGGVAHVIFDLPNITINGLTGDLFEAWSEMDVVQSTNLQGIRIDFASSTLFPDTTSQLQVVNGVYRTMPAALSGNQSTATWQATFQLAASGSCQVKIHNLMCRKVPAGQ